MSDDLEDKERGAYEVGYRKPPKEHQFKPKSRITGSGGGAKKSKRRKSAETSTKKVNLADLLSEPVHVRKHDQVHKMDPFEAMLRKQVERAFKQRSLSAIKTIFDYAIKYELVVKAPAVRSGGVLIVSMATDQEFEFWQNFRDKSDAEFRAMLRKSR